MTMIARFTQDHQTMDPILTVRIVGNRDVELFKQLMLRATNCWDGAPPQVKELADLVCEDGKILQDYWMQANKSPME